jgi:hypothetical protein
MSPRTLAHITFISAHDETVLSWHENDLSDAIGLNMANDLTIYGVMVENRPEGFEWGKWPPGGCDRVYLEISGLGEKI